jgi:hydrogenase nickel incorporation protein HypA/HybF
MHELSLTRSIVAIVAEHAAGRRVRRVRIALGPMACVERRALDFCFGLAAEGTSLAGAELALVEAEGDTLLIRDYELEETG